MPWIVVNGGRCKRMSDDQDGCELVCIFWYRPTRVVPDQRPLNVCVCDNRDIKIISTRCIVPYITRHLVNLVFSVLSFSDLLLLQPFNGLFSRTTWVSRYQKGKTNLDFTGTRDSEWQWHQLGHMHVCTSLQTDNHARPHHSVFYRPDALPAAQPTASKQ